MPANAYKKVVKEDNKYKQEQKKQSKQAHTDKISQAKVLAMRERQKLRSLVEWSRAMADHPPRYDMSQRHAKEDRLAAAAAAAK